MAERRYDFIVVGAGSAGCVLANRLSADGRRRVLLLEAGPRGHWLSRMPVSFAKLIDNPAANWCYRAEPDEGSGGRAIPIPRGRLLGGSIINISSIYGIVGSEHNAAYHASKGAVRTFSKSAAAQYATEGIRVNSVHPGFVDSPMTQVIHDNPERAAPRLAQTPMGHFGQPIDIANGCLFLASDESRWMTGAELVIDGGMTAV